MSNRQKLKALKRMTATALAAMTDEQLLAISATDPHDLSGLTDEELAAVINDTASPALLARVEATRTTP